MANGNGNGKKKRTSTGWMQTGEGAAQKTVVTRGGVTKVKTRTTGQGSSVFTKTKTTAGGFKFADVKRTKTTDYAPGTYSKLYSEWQPKKFTKTKTKTRKRGGTRTVYRGTVDPSRNVRYIQEKSKPVPPIKSPKP